LLAFLAVIVALLGADWASLKEGDTHSTLRSTSRCHLEITSAITLYINSGLPILCPAGYILLLRIIHPGHSELVKEYPLSCLGWIYLLDVLHFIFLFFLSLPSHKNLGNRNLVT